MSNIKNENRSKREQLFILLTKNVKFFKKEQKIVTDRWESNPGLPASSATLYPIHQEG